MANIKYIKQKLSGAGGGKPVLNDEDWELVWDPKTEGDGKKKEVEEEDDSSPVFFNLGGKSRSTDRKVCSDFLFVCFFFKIIILLCV